MLTIFRIAIIFFLFNTVAFSEPEDSNLSKIMMTKNDYKRINSGRVFFHHMSIGRNILDGLQRLKQDHLDIVKIDLSTEKTVLAPSTLSHAFFGQNGDPYAKINLFEKTLNEGLSNDPDVALMKLCYSDFKPGMDVDKLFQHYANVIEELKKKHPDTIFIHVTTPLLPKDIGIKELIKSTFGYKDGNAQANIQRGKYNELIRSHFTKETIFDLARVESTWPDGRKETFVRDGKVWQSLVPEFTNDGAHLHGEIQERAATELLQVLEDIFDAKRY